jgi:GAF domain-containing protein
MPAEEPLIAAPGAELERLRLENETLSAVVGVVASGPDLAHILDRVVDLLTRATNCHACFIYLRGGDQLLLRAASPVYAHLAGKISFRVDQGLAGWVVRRGEAAFIREDATGDPRTHHVPELEEERFQSMVAVPIPSRAGQSLGALVLHTAAPREFDERIINVLARAASLVAGAIENAGLYEEAQERVKALTQLSLLGREIAAVTDRRSLFKLAVGRVRELVDAELCVLYEAEEPNGALRRAASVPVCDPPQGEGESDLVIELLESREPPDLGVRTDIARRLGLGEAPLVAEAVSLTTGGRRTGAVLATAHHHWPESAPELFRAAAQQVALATEKIELIERLTEENLARDLFDALVEGRADAAAAKAETARIDLERRHLVIEARPLERDDPVPWAERAKKLERTIKASAPEAFCDIGPASLRALVPVADGSSAVVTALSDQVAGERVAFGMSDPQSGVPGLIQALQEAIDATRIASLLGSDDIVAYRDTGAYRYLVDALDSGGPHDYLRAAVDRLIAYDRERRSQLLLTLDEYLSQGRSIAAASRTLFIHVNTLRQRLERIEELTGLTLASEDLLALQLAVKLGLVR